MTFTVQQGQTVLQRQHRTVAVLFLLACSIVADPLLHPQNDSFEKSWSACVGGVDGCMQLNCGNYIIISDIIRLLILMVQCVSGILLV